MNNYFHADIDECANGNNDCDTTANFECINTPGSFVCVCAAGYQLVEGNCVSEIFIVNAVTGTVSRCS